MVPACMKVLAVHIYVWDYLSSQMDASLSREPCEPLAAEAKARLVKDCPGGTNQLQPRPLGLAPTGSPGCMRIPRIMRIPKNHQELGAGGAAGHAYPANEILSCWVQGGCWLRWST